MGKKRAGVCGGEQHLDFSFQACIPNMPAAQKDGLSRPPRLVAKSLLCAQDMYRHLWSDAYLQRRDKRAQDLDKRETRGLVGESWWRRAARLSQLCGSVLRRLLSRIIKWGMSG